ncbi:MAG TPA: hypothetical protein PLF26_21395 [Blastocatellia bacterium]|nr:hypothetical protein [Blastocatellia bacterium]
METDPILDVLANAFPVILLTFLGLLCIYSVVGVPIGLVLLGMAVAVAVMKVHGEA